MRTMLIFWITIGTITGATMGLSPMLCALEGHSPVVTAGETLPCVSIARANRDASDHL